MAGETIERAAIRRYSTIWSVPRPGRHRDVIAFMAEQSVESVGCEQGFVTSADRFVDRREAMKIARAAGQLISGPPEGAGLFSEDVW